MLRYEWVDEKKQLDSWFAHLNESSVIALDTEGNSYHGYNPKICLLQIATTERIGLFDALALTPAMLESLSLVLRDPAVLKIMHAADNDLIGLRRDYDTRVHGLFDTFLASRFLAFPKHGLDSLLEQFFAAKTSKKFQRLDWRLRPLPQGALKYAAMDVAYLLELQEILREKLEESGWLSAVEQESEALTTRPLQEKSFDPEGFRKLRYAKELTQRQLGVLRAIYLWRHRYCKKHDRAAYFVLSDAQMILLARKQPRNLHRLREVMSSVKGFRHFKEELVEAIHLGLREGLPARPSKPKRSGRRAVDSALFDALRAWRKTEAESVGLEPGLLANNQLLQRISSEKPDSLESLAELPGMLPWRLERYGEALLSVVAAE